MNKISVSLFFSFCCFAKNPVPKFEVETIDNEVGIGYGVQLADMNADNMTDILLVDKDKVAWYENPTWKKHILVGHLTKRDHVCLTARDLNGDGQAEIALGGEWNPNDTINSGAIFYLHPREGKKTFGQQPQFVTNLPLIVCIGKRKKEFILSGSKTIAWPGE